MTGLLDPTAFGLPFPPAFGLGDPLAFGVAAALALVAGGLGTLGGASWLLAAAAAAAGVPAALALTALKLQGLCGDAAVVAMSLRTAGTHAARRETVRRVLRAVPAGALGAASLQLGTIGWACLLIVAIGLLLGSRLRVHAGPGTPARPSQREPIAALALATYIGALGFAATSLHVACARPRNAQHALSAWQEAKCIGCGANLGATLLLGALPGTLSPALWALLALQVLGALAGARVLLSFGSDVRRA